MNAFWHLGLTVADLDASMDFYRDVAEMEVSLGPFEGGGIGMEELMELPGLAVRYCWMRHGDLNLQLLEYTAKQGHVNRLAHNNVGSPHLAFVVPDVEQKYASVRRDHPGVRVTPAIVDMGVARTFYAYDPDGLPVEFWQWKVAPADPTAPLGGPSSNVRK